MPPGQSPPAGVLERGLVLLECFSEERLRLHLRDIAQMTGLDKATLLRLLGTFIRHRFVQRLDDGRYSPGPALLGLGALYRATFDLSTRMQPVLHNVMQQTGESVAFFIRSGDSRVCLFRANAPRAASHHVEVGSSIPLVEGGSSSHVLRAYTDGSTPRAADVLGAGYAITRRERLSDLTSMSMPVFDGDRSFLGALTVIGLANRQTKAAQIAATAIVAQELANQGFSSRPPAGRRPA